MEPGSLRQDALEAFRAEVRDWLAGAMAPAADLRWSAVWTTRDNEAKAAANNQADVVAFVGDDVAKSQDGKG